MAIRVTEKVDIALLEKALIRRNWKEGRFNGGRAFIKDVGEWTWVAVLSGGRPYFLSLPSEDLSELHTRGVKRLLRELEDIGREAGFTLPLRI